MQQFKNYLKVFISEWWLSPLLLMLFCVSLKQGVIPFSSGSQLIFAVLFISLLASIGWQISRAGWKFGVLQIIWFAASFMIVAPSDMPWVTHSDHFADKLFIPKSLPYAKVIGRPHEVNPIPTTCDNEKLLLYYGAKAGMYQATICVETKESGTLHMRAYEATTLTPISALNIRKNTTLKINASDPSLLTTQNFFIEEGRPGQNYAAKFEVWFAPDSGKPEALLVEKVFAIEGGD